MDMPAPQDKQALQRFLGMVNYVSKFIEHLSEKAKPLRDLIKKEIEWHWTHVQEKAYKDLKRSLTEAPFGIL